MWHLDYEKRPKCYWYRLNDELLTTFTNKFLVDKRSLILRGSDFFLRFGRRIYNLDVKRICEYMENNQFIIYLDLAYNLIDDQGFGTLINFIQCHPNQLIGLNVMCNHITDSGMKMLAECTNFTLQSLRINGNKITSIGQKWIAKLLMTNGHLVHLDIAEMDMHMESLVHILGALRHLDRGSNDTLTMLDLSRPLGPIYHQFQADQWAERVGQMLQFNNSLRELHLEKSHMRGSSIEYLTLGLLRNRNLRVLNISCNAFGPDGALHLANMLKDPENCPPLQALIMNRCEIGDHGAGYLTFALPSSKIRMLDIGYNNLTDEGVLNILYSIKKTIMLNTLYIWGNKMTQKICQIIKRMLLSKVLFQDRLDVIIYTVDNKIDLAYNPVDRYKQLYYAVDDYGWPQPKCLKSATNYYINPLQIEQTYKNKIKKIKKPEYSNKLLDPFGIAVWQFYQKHYEKDLYEDMEYEGKYYTEEEEGEIKEEEEFKIDSSLIDQLSSKIQDELQIDILDAEKSSNLELEFSIEPSIEEEYVSN